MLLYMRAVESKYHVIFGNSLIFCHILRGKGMEREKEVSFSNFVKDSRQHYSFNKIVISEFLLHPLRTRVVRKRRFHAIIALRTHGFTSLP